MDLESLIAEHDSDDVGLAIHSNGELLCIPVAHRAAIILLTVLEHGVAGLASIKDDVAISEHLSHLVAVGETRRLHSPVTMLGQRGTDTSQSNLAERSCERHQN